MAKETQAEGQGMPQTRETCPSLTVAPSTLGGIWNHHDCAPSLSRLALKPELSHGHDAESHGADCGDARVAGSLWIGGRGDSRCGGPDCFPYS